LWKVVLSRHKFIKSIYFCFFLWCYWEREHSGDVISESCHFVFSGWFERKLIVASVVVGLWNMSISRCQGYDICTLPTLFTIILRNIRGI